MNVQLRRTLILCLTLFCLLSITVLSASAVIYFDGTIAEVDDAEQAKSQAIAEGMKYSYTEGDDTYYVSGLVAGKTLVDIVNTDGATEKTVTLDGATYTINTNKTVEELAADFNAVAVVNGAYYTDLDAADAAAVAALLPYRVDGTIATYVTAPVAGGTVVDLVNTTDATDKVVTIDGVTYTVTTGLTADALAYNLGARAFFGTYYADVADADAAAMATHPYRVDGTIATYVTAPVAGGTVIDLVNTTDATEKTVTVDGATYTINTSKTVEELAADFNVVAVVNGAYYTDLNAADAAAVAALLPYRVNGAIATYVAAPVAGGTVVDLVNTDGATDKTVTIDGVTYTVNTNLSVDDLAYALGARAFFGTYYADVADADAAALAGGAAYRVVGDIATYVNAPVAGGTVVDLNATGSTSTHSITVDGTAYTVVTDKSADALAIDLGAVARLNDTTTYYTRLANACVAATTGSTVYVITSYSNSGENITGGNKTFAIKGVDLGGGTYPTITHDTANMLSIQGGATVTISDLNVVMTSGYFAYVTGNITLTDTVTITGTASKDLVQALANSSVVVNGATVDIIGGGDGFDIQGTARFTGGASITFKNGEGAAKLAVYNNNGTVIVDNATISGTYAKNGNAKTYLVGANASFAAANDATVYYDDAAAVARGFNVRIGNDSTTVSLPDGGSATVYPASAYAAAMNDALVDGAADGSTIYVLASHSVSDGFSITGKTLTITSAGGTFELSTNSSWSNFIQLTGSASLTLSNITINVPKYGAKITGSDNVLTLDAGATINANNTTTGTWVISASSNAIVNVNSGATINAKGSDAANYVFQAAGTSVITVADGATITTERTGFINATGTSTVTVGAATVNATQSDNSLYVVQAAAGTTVTFNGTALTITTTHTSSNNSPIINNGASITFNGGSITYAGNGVDFIHNNTGTITFTGGVTINTTKGGDGIENLATVIFDGATYTSDKYSMYDNGGKTYVLNATINATTQAAANGGATYMIGANAIINLKKASIYYDIDAAIANGNVTRLGNSGTTITLPDDTTATVYASTAFYTSIDDAVLAVAANGAEIYLLKSHTQTTAIKKQDEDFSYVLTSINKDTITLTVGTTWLFDIGKSKANNVTLKNITIDVGAKNLGYFSNTGGIVIDNGTYIYGTGKSASEGLIHGYGSAAHIVVNAGATIEATGSYPMFGLANNAKLTVNGGTFNGGAFIYATGTSVVTIEDATYNFTTGSVIGIRTTADATLTINGGTINASNAASGNVIRIDGSATIDAVTVTVTACNNNPVRISGETTINGGTFTYSAATNGFFYVCEDGVATFTGGTFTTTRGAMLLDGEQTSGKTIKVTIKGGDWTINNTLAQDAGGNVNLITHAVGEMSITGGTFTATATKNNAIKFASTTTISGGTFSNAAGAAMFYVTSSVALPVSSATFTNTSGGFAQLDSNASITVASGTYTNTTTGAMFDLGDTTSATFNGGTFNGGAFVVSAGTSYITINDGAAFNFTTGSGARAFYAKGTAASFTMNGGTITASNSASNNVGRLEGPVAITGGTITVTAANNNPFRLSSTANTISGGTFTNGTGSAMFYIVGATVDVTGGNYDANGTGGIFQLGEAAGKLNISGGTLVQYGNGNMIHYANSSTVYVSGTATFIHEGGAAHHIFNRASGALKIEGEGVKLIARGNNFIFENGYQDKITGFNDNNKLIVRGAYLSTERADGIFVRDDVGASYFDLSNITLDGDAIAKNLHGDEDLNGTSLVYYFVARSGVAKTVVIPATNNTEELTKTVYTGYYTNLSDAVKAVAAETASVYVLNNGTAARTAMTITGNVTIYLNGNTITAAEANDVLFDVKAGATLTILNGTIKCSNRFAYVYGTVNLGDAAGETGAFLLTDPNKITTYMFEVIGAGNLNVYKNATLKTTTAASVGAANYIQMVSTFTGAVNVYGTVELNHAVTGNYKMFRFNSGGTATGALNVYDGAVLTYNCVPSAASNEHAVFYNYDQAKAVINIYGGTVKNTSGKGVLFFLANGTTNISGGELTSNGSYGIFVHSAAPTINVSGGTLTASGAGTVNVYTKGSAVMNITGGTFIATADVNAHNVYLVHTPAYTITNATFIHNGKGNALRINNSTNNVNITGNTQIIHNGATDTNNIALNREGGKYIYVDGADANLVISAPNGAYTLRTAYYVTFSNLTLNGTTATMGTAGEDKYMVFTNVTIPSVELGESWLANVIVSCDGKNVAFSDATKAFTYVNTLGAKDITVSLGKDTKVNRGKIAFTSGAHIIIDGRGHKMEVNGSNATYLFLVQAGRTMTLKNVRVWNCPSKFAEVAGNLYITENSSIIATSSTSVTETTPMLLIWSTGNITLDAGCTVATEYAGGTAINGEPNLSGKIESYYLIQSSSDWNGSMTINGTLRQGWNAAGQWSAVFRFNGGGKGTINIGATAVLEGNAAAGCAGGNALIISDATIILNVADGATFTCPNYSIFRITNGSFTVNGGTYTNNRTTNLFDVAGGTLTIKSGTFNGGNFVYSTSTSKVVIDGGTFNLTADSTRTFFAYGASTTLTINDITLNASGAKSNNVIRADGTFVMNGGSVTVTAAKNNPIRFSGVATINGGTFVNNTGYGFFYVCEDAIVNFAGGNYSYTNGNMVQNGEQTSGKTVQITVSGGNWSVSGTANEMFKHTVGELTISGGTINGRHVVKATGSTKTVFSGNAVINFDGQSSSERAFYINGTSTQFEMHGGTINATNSKSSNVIRAEGKVHITGGLVDVKAAGNNPIRFSSTAVVVDGGTFKNATNQQFFYLAQEANVTFNGGTFLTTGNAMIHCGEQTSGKTIKVTINGGDWTINNTKAKDAGGNTNLITLNVGELTITGGTFNALATYNNPFRVATKATISGATLNTQVGSYFFYVPKGNLTLGEGNVYNAAVGLAQIDQGATLTFTGGTYTFPANGQLVKPSASTVNFKGGTFNGGSLVVTSGACPVNVSGGTFNFTGTADIRAFYTGATSPLTISGGTINATSATSSNVIRADGAFTMTGGTVKVTAAKNNPIRLSGEATINGGTFINETGYGFFYVCEDAIVNFADGNYSYTAGSMVQTGEQTSGKTIQINVSGGNWSTTTAGLVFTHNAGELTISGGKIDARCIVKATGSTKTVITGNAVLNFDGQSSSERAVWANGTSTVFEMHGGTINATNAKSSNVIRAEGTVRITDGLIDVKAAGNNPVRISANAVIDGGTFKNATAQQFFYLAQEANVTINGGNFLTTGNAMIHNGEQTDGKTIKVTINGGYFEINTAGKYNLISHTVGEMSITGGTFNAIASTNNPIKLAAKASVTGGTYANTTSSLMLYVTSGVALNVSNVIFNGTSGFAYVDGKANVTVANGNFRSVDAAFTVKSDSTVTVNGGSFNGALATVEGGKLVVNAGSFISNADKAIITASSGSLALNAGSFEQTGKKSNASILSFTGSGSVTATLKGTSLVLRSTMPAIRSTNAAATVTVDGISFVSYAKLYEGTFADFNVTSLALASDSVARMNGAIVRLNNKRVGNGGLATNFKTGYYFDLASALAAAKDGDTLYLLNSFELAPNELRVTAKTITLAGATDGIVITAKDASDYLIYVVDGGSLTLENVTVLANGNGIGIRATADASSPSVFTLGANAKLYGERIDAQSLIYVYGGKYATVNVYGTVGFGKNDGSAELLGCNANPYVIRSASGFEGTITVTGTVYNLLTKKTPDWHHLFRMEGATGTLVLDGATLIHQLAPHAEYTTTNAIVWNDGITVMKDSTFITNTNAFYNSVGTPLIKVENCDFSQVKTAIKASNGNAGCDFMDDMSAAALGYGFRIGETYYKTIADAIKALPKVDAETYASVTIYVTGGATTGTGTIDGNYDVTLKGTYEGATLTETGGTFLTLKNGASLIVEDINFATNGALFNYTAGERNGSFVIRNSKITGAGTMSGSLIVVAGKANVVIGEDVLFDTTGATASAQVQLFEAGASFEGTADIYADFIHGASGAYNHKIIRSSSTLDNVINIHESATLTYNCPDVAASDEAAVIYNYATSTSTVINVRGAKIAHNVANGAISYICNGATLNVYDATLTSVAKSFVVKAKGNVNVYGGDFTMAGESAFTNAGFVTIYGGSFHLANEEASIVVDAAGGSSNMLSYVANGVSSANGIVAAGVTPVVKDGELKLLFTATLTSSAYADLKALADEGEVTFGMLLVPAAALNGTSFNHKALAGSDFVDVVAEGDALTVAANGNATIAIEQGGLDAATEYAAIFYAKYSVNGATVYTYSGYTAEDNNADLVSVATAALADVSATPDSVYCYKVAEGVFSRYDRAACEILAKYVAK